MPRNCSYPIYSPYIESQLKMKLSAVNVSYAAFFSFCIDSGEVPQKAETLKVRDLKDLTSYKIMCDGIIHSSPLSKDTIQFIQLSCQGKSDDDYVFTAKGKTEPIKRTSLCTLVSRQAESIGYENVISYTSIRKTHFYHVYQKYGIEKVQTLLHLRSIYAAYDYLGISAEDKSVEYEGLSDTLKEQIADTNTDDIVSIINKINDIEHSMHDITLQLKQDKLTKTDLHTINDLLSNIQLIISSHKPSTH